MEYGSLANKIGILEITSLKGEVRSRLEVLLFCNSDQKHQRTHSERYPACNLRTQTTFSNPSEPHPTIAPPSSPLTEVTHSAANAERARKAAKSGNKYGDPISMKSKILAAIPDPANPSGSIFIAESAGFARRVNLEVRIALYFTASMLLMSGRQVKQRLHTEVPRRR